MGEEPNKRSGLEMRFDPGHERTEWMVQRVGWGLMFLVCIAALAGFLGDGPVSRAQEGREGDDLHLEYHRFVRHQAPFTVKVFCRTGGDKQFSLGFTRRFLENHEIKEIQPEPESTISEGEKSVFLFKANGKEQLVTFRFESDAFGKAQGEVTLDGRETQKMEQFIWP
jgi:hypothetical protein